MSEGDSNLSVKDFLDRARAITSFEDLESLRKDSIQTENYNRELFARQRDNWEIPELDDNFHYLIDVFSSESLENSALEIFKCIPKFDEDNVPRVFPLKNRRAAGELGIVSSLNEFNQSWNSLTEDCLRFLDWTNIFAAGGAVAGCLAPLPESIRNVKGFGPQRMARRKYFHDEYLPGSDIDLFLYGIDEEQAKAKLLEIYDAVQAASPFPVRAFRSTHAITLVSQYPFRHVQIILRIYNSASEVLCGFDVDSCAVGFDGSRVLIPPRTAMAIMTQSNTVDMSRRSPSYETRLAKYASRGFEILVPALERDRVDPFLFEKRFDQAKGLSRLLLLEKLRTPEERLRYRIEKQMKSSGHSNWRLQTRLRQLQNDRWNMNRQEGTEGVQLETAAGASDYATIFLPWGPDWTASKIERQMKKKDIALNKVQFKENGEVTVSTRPYKIHVCAIGTMEEVIADPFPNDPPLPKDLPSDDLDSMVYGEVSWLVDNPGRQQIGSFHPITDEDWSDGAYFTIAAENLTKAAVTNDSEKIETLFHEKKGESDESQKNFLASKDFLGRTTLHLAALAGSVEACEKLLNHPLVNGDYLKARLPDGRTALHISAMKGNVAITKLILEKRKSIADGDVASPDQVDYNVLFDVLDIDGADWEKKLSPLQYAIALGQVEIVQLLIAYDADVRKMAVHKDVEQSYSSLSLLAFYASECGKTGISNVKPIVNLLLEAGASFTQVDKGSTTCWHYLAIISDELEWNALPIFLEAAKSHVTDTRLIALDTLDRHLRTPLYIATLLGNCKSVELLLSYGASPSPSDQLWSRMLPKDFNRHRNGISDVDFNSAMQRTPIFLAASLVDIKTLEAYCKVKTNLVNVSVTIMDPDHERRGLFGGFHFNSTATIDQPTKTIRILDVLEEMLRKEKNPSKSARNSRSHWEQQDDTIKATIAEVEKKLSNCTVDEHQSLERMWLCLMLEREKGNLRSNKRNFGRTSDEECTFTREDRLAQLQNAIEVIKDLGGKCESVAKQDELKVIADCFAETTKISLPDPMVTFNDISFRGFNTYDRYYNTKKLSDAIVIDRVSRIFQLVYTEDVSELKSAVALTNIYVENAVGKTTALFLAVLRGNIEVLRVVFNEASRQYQRHINKERATLEKKKEREEEMNKRLKNNLNNKNTIQGLVNRVNNLELATGDLPNMVSGPDSVRFELENAEAELVDDDLHKDTVLSSLPPESLLLHRSFLKVDEDVVKLKQHLQEKFSRNQDKSTLISLRPIELAVIKGELEMIKEIITLAGAVGTRLSSEKDDKTVFKHEINSSEDKEDDSEYDSDCDSEYDSDCDSECGNGFDDKGLASKSMTQEQLRYSLVGPRSTNHDLGLSLLEMAAAMDNVEIFCYLASYAREFALPLKVICLWKSQIDPTNEITNKLNLSPQPGNYSPLHFIFKCGSKNLIDVAIARGLDKCLIGWLLEKPYEVLNTSTVDDAFLKPFYESADWLSRQFFDTKKSKEEIAEKICRVVTVDPLKRSPLFYVPAEFVPQVVEEAAKYFASKDSSTKISDYKSKFVNSVTPNGVSALIAAAACGDKNKVHALINEGANRSVITNDSKKWGVLHFVIENFGEVSKAREMIEILLEDATDSELDSMLLSPSAEHTPLMIAVSRGREEEITLLLYEKTLSRSINSFAHCDKEMNNVLHLAAKGNGKNNYIDLVKHLISHSSTLPSKENARGYTASEVSLEKVLSMWSGGNFGGKYQHVIGRYTKPLVPPRSIAKNPNKLSIDKTGKRNAFVILEANTTGRLAASFNEVKANTYVATESTQEESVKSRHTFVESSSQLDTILPTLS